MKSLAELGYAKMPSCVSATERSALRDGIFREAEAGIRCMLDLPIVHRVASAIKNELVVKCVLTDKSAAIQAIAFDKTRETNWKVTWHQDLMFPFAKRVTSARYTLPCVKDKVDYARPPREVVEHLLAVRLHLDRCDQTNGPLRVAPGSHLEGVVAASDIAARVEHFGELVCLADEGDILLMRPFLLHASSKASEPKHRRVLHFVYYDGPAIDEVWHRSVV